MRCRLDLKSGQRGTKKASSVDGDQLLCMRYSYDEKNRKRLKTVELIVEETEWVPKDRPSLGARLVTLRIDWNE